MPPPPKRKPKKPNNGSPTWPSKLDPGDRWTFPFALGAVLVIALVVLDAFPLNWAAQAFGLDSGATLVVTVILLIAAIAAMVGFEVTRDHARPRGILIAIVTAGFLALLGLRAEYLITVSGDSFPVAVFQSTILTAISAGLVVCGSACWPGPGRSPTPGPVPPPGAPPGPPSEARAAYDEAVDKLHRHIGTIHQMILPEALRFAAPEGVGYASWAAALEQAIRALFPLT